MSCNPSSLREVEAFRGLLPGVTDTVRLGYSQRKKGLSPWLSTVEKMTKNEQTSYIFAKCKGERAHAISQIEHIPNVESATPVTGRFDLVIKLGTNEPTKAFTTMEKIRDIPSITNTQTTISFESIINSSNKADSESPLAFALLKVKGSFWSLTSSLVKPQWMRWKG